MPAKLYVVPASHPCAAVMKALEMKGIAYKTVNLAPPLHKAATKARFGTSSVPAIRFEDGEKVTGSRTILRALESRRPTPPLFPADASRRLDVEEAEEWGDQVLQPLVRRVIWMALSAKPAAQLSYLPEGARLTPPTPRFVARLGGGAVAWAASRINDSNEPNVRADLKHLPGHMDRVDAWIERGVLGGEALNAADLQIASSVRLLLTIEDVAPMVEGRPAAELARRVFPSYPGGVPSGALPSSWLEPSAAAV